MNATVDKFGRIVIPKPIRDRLGLAPGARLSIALEVGASGDASIALTPTLEQPLLTDKDGLLVFTGAIEDDKLDVVEFLREQRRERSRDVSGF